MAPCELLLLNGAKVDLKDNQGQTALHHATILGHTGWGIVQGEINKVIKIISEENYSIAGSQLQAMLWMTMC